MMCIHLSLSILKYLLLLLKAPFCDIIHISSFSLSQLYPFIFGNHCARFLRFGMHFSYFSAASWSAWTQSKKTALILSLCVCLDKNAGSVYCFKISCSKPALSLSWIPSKSQYLLATSRKSFNRTHSVELILIEQKFFIVRNLINVVIFFLDQIVKKTGAYN